MVKQNLDVKAGDLIVFSSGTHSDYGYDGHFVALEDISDTSFKEIEAMIKEQDESKYVDISPFIPELIRRGLILNVNVRQIHLGNYGLDLK